MRRPEVRATLRTILVIVAGIALSLLLYIAADLAFGHIMNADGTINSNFSALTSTWKALGGSAGPIDAERTQGASPFGGMGGQAPALDDSDIQGGMPPFAGGRGGFGAGLRGGGRAQPVDIAHGFDPSQAPGQTGSDLLWLGIPAVIGIAIEIDATLLRKRRQKKAAS
jgi:hypothetical protein